MSLTGLLRLADLPARGPIATVWTGSLVRRFEENDLNVDRQRGSQVPSFDQKVLNSRFGF